MSLYADPASPQVPGTLVTIGATATCDVGVTPEFQFLLGDENGYTTVQDYSASPSFAWDTSTSTEANYTVLVRTRAQGTTGSMGWGDAQIGQQYSVSSDLGSCSDVSETASIDSPRPAGTPVAVTAVATCTPDTPAEYQFFIFPGPTTGGWDIVQDFSSSPTFNWDTTTFADGTYDILVRTRRAGLGSGFEAQGILFFDVTDATSGVCDVLDETFTPNSPAAPGVVTFTATATCSGNAVPEYQFIFYDPGTSIWNNAQDWSLNNTFVWDNTALAENTYPVMARTRRRGNLTGSDFEQQAIAFFTTQTTPPPPPLCTSLVASSDSYQAPAGTVFNVSGVAACATPVYQFWLQDQSTGAFNIVQDYSPSSTFAWDSTGLAPGDYFFMVRARDAAATVSQESQDGVNITVQ